MIDAPIYNFSMPSQLKAWVDLIAQASKICRHTENGPVRLAGHKKASSHCLATEKLVIINTIHSEIVKNNNHM